VAALAGALGAALSAMVAELTYGKKDYKDVWQEMDQVAVQAQSLKDFFLQAIDDDTKAFNKVMAAFKIKGKTDEAKAAKKRAIEDANKEATMVPFQVLEKVPEILTLAKTVAEKGNQNSVSDAGVSALMAGAAADGAFYNVRINLMGIEDEAFVKDTANKAQELREKIRTELVKIDNLILQKLEM